jgi:hypothetical protein
MSYPHQAHSDRLSVAHFLTLCAILGAATASCAPTAPEDAGGEAGTAGTGAGPMAGGGGGDSDGEAGNAGDGGVGDCMPPSVETQPIAQSVIAPASAVFEVAALGTDVVYRWQRAESAAPTAFGDVIGGSGAAEAVYTTGSTVMADDNGAKYRCVVENQCGSITSEAVTLAVTEGYSVTGYNSASWAGSSSGSEVATNANGYLPLVASDCPKDPNMQVTEPYKDKIWNGCLDECSGDPNMWGHGQANVFDFNLTAGGWVVAQLASNLHWTGMWAPATGPHPTTLVFWIKGAAGGEQDRFTVSIHAHGTNNNSAAVKVPVVVTTAWQRVVIPWTSLKVLSSPYPDAVTFSATAPGRTLFFVDQVYLSKTVPLPE